MRKHPSGENSKHMFLYLIRLLVRKGDLMQEAASVYEQ